MISLPGPAVALAGFNTTVFAVYHKTDPGLSDQHLAMDIIALNGLLYLMETFPNKINYLQLIYCSRNNILKNKSTLPDTYTMLNTSSIIIYRSYRYDRRTVTGLRLLNILQDSHLKKVVLSS